VTVTAWTLTMDSDDPLVLARFWALALGYVEKSPPEDCDTWEDWLRHFEARSLAHLEQPDGSLDHVVMADPEGNEFCVV
jgi:hypothetical protein